MKRLLKTLLLTSLITQTSYANNQNTPSQLFLIGGGLKTCSSMAIKNCDQNGLAKIKQTTDAKAGNVYQLNKNSIELVKSQWQGSASEKKYLLKLLNKISKSTSSALLSLNDLKDQFQKYDNKNLIQKLSDPLYYTLLDLLEQPVLNLKTGERLKEKIVLLNSKNIFSTDLYQKFVKIAQGNSGKDKPNIVVLTASARDPFEAADFYQSVFQQAGAKSKWLPLDATLNSLWQIKGSREKVCQSTSDIRAQVQGSVNREFIYPDLAKQQHEACLNPENIYQALSAADGLFINGGDQSLTLKAFINKDGSESKALTLIKKKLKSGSFIVGGTSAGTAVMSGGSYENNATVMITNGQSGTALVRGTKKNMLPTEGCQKSNSCNPDLLNSDLTYNEKGGLGLFSWGILDTHFSERGRQGRLAVLTQETKSTFAFGVDEATALIVNDINAKTPTFNVVGQSGVFIIENKLNTNHTVNSHYLTHGDSASLQDNQLKFTLADWKVNSLENNELLPIVKNIFIGNRYQKATEILCRTSQNKLHAVSRWKNNITKVLVKKQTNSQNKYGTITNLEVESGYCSYLNYQLSFTH